MRKDDGSGQRYEIEHSFLCDMQATYVCEDRRTVDKWCAELTQDAPVGTRVHVYDNKVDSYIWLWCSLQEVL